MAHIFDIIFKKKVHIDQWYCGIRRFIWVSNILVKRKKEKMFKEPHFSFGPAVFRLVELRTSRL